jgi:hypothetical protein
VNEQAEAGWRRQTLIHPGPDCRKVVRRRAPPRDLGLNAPDSLDGGGLRGASRGLGSRAIKDGCSFRKCRLQKSVRGILPATLRWAARHIKAGQGRARRPLLPRQRRRGLAKYKMCSRRVLESAIANVKNK